MRKYSFFLFVLLSPLSLFIADCNLLNAEDIGFEILEKRYPHSAHFKMDIYENGLLTERKLVVDLLIVADKHGNIIAGYWDHILIFPWHDSKKMMLKTQNFSIKDGDMTNVISEPNHFSFILNLVDTWKTMKIIGKKIDRYTYDVKGFGFWLGIKKEEIKREWRSTNKIVLPYREIY